MARKQVMVSDLTGEVITDERLGATVTIRYNDPRTPDIVLDVGTTEIQELASKGVRKSRRGRKPKEPTPAETTGADQRVGYDA